MQFELRSISKEGIPEALAKVERYRLLNEPAFAESICLDILAIEPDNQQALISLLLARTDQFHSNANARAAQEVLARIQGDYERAYYSGIIWERLATDRIRQGDPGAMAAACHSLREAMSCYETAISLAPRANDDAILRWNTCARVIMQTPAMQLLPDDGPTDAWMLDETISRGDSL